MEMDDLVSGLRRAFRIFATNSWDGSTLSLDSAYFNHSCVPNVSFADSVESSPSLTIFQTTQDVEAGEQLFVNYLEQTGIQFDERKKRLEDGWGISCNCSSCLLTGTDQQQDDDKRRRISEILRITRDTKTQLATAVSVVDNHLFFQQMIGLADEARGLQESLGIRNGESIVW
jgi:hypothetical protein